MPITVSSKEPKPVRLLMQHAHPEVEQALWPEDFGFDFAWVLPFEGIQIAGVQRKEFPGDFLASLFGDERLNKEILQMQAQEVHPTWKYIVLEGRPSWSSEGKLQVAYGGGIDQNTLQKMMFSITLIRGIQFVWTANASETVTFVRRFYEWSTKKKHTGFGAQADTIPGSRGKKDWREWILLRFQDMGIARARAILNFDPEPLQWRDGGMWLTQVPGIGPVLANQYRRALKPDQQED